nr:hypothetical protein [Actinomycetota bacterium]
MRAAAKPWPPLGRTAGHGIAAGCLGLATLGAFVAGGYALARTWPRQRMPKRGATRRVLVWCWFLAAAYVGGPLALALVYRPPLSPLALFPVIEGAILGATMALV